MSKPDLAAVLANAGGSTRRKPQPQATPAAPEGQEQAKGYTAPSRRNTKPLTVHFPKQVRDQIKILAVENDTTMQNLLAEALNDLFVKYGKPEVAPYEKGRP